MQFADSDFAKQAQMGAANFAKQAQLAGKNVGENFNRFVEGNEGHQSNQIPTRSNMDETKRSFWDDFSALANDGTSRQKPQQSSAIGTSAMGMGSKKQAKPVQKKNDDGWDDW